MMLERGGSRPFLIEGQANTLNHMSGMQSDVQWYIARDGQQHGPLNEPEMRLFVERGYLKDGDLVWRQGFSDWRPAFSVFTRPTASTAPGQHPAGPDAMSAPMGQPNQPVPAAADPAVTHSGHSARMSASDLSDAFAATQSNGGHVASDHAGNRDDEAAYYNSDEETPRRGGRIAAGLFVLALLGGAGGYYYKDEVMRLVESGQRSAAVPVIKAPGDDVKTTQGAADKMPAQTAALSPETAPAPQPQPVTVLNPEIDARLQKAELWQFVKKTHGDWYRNVLEEASRLPAGDDFDQNLSTLLIKKFIEFRRQNADQALAGSTTSLKSMANAFLNNLKDLAGRDTKACYTFISKGESSPAIVELMKQPEAPSAVHGQMLAIFKAAAEGKQAPITHAAPEKKDYEALTQQLMKIGWSKEDIQLFASPAALSRAEPAKVCQMVQDWFTAHLSLKNADSQERLLFETLRPVVAG